MGVADPVSSAFAPELIVLATTLLLAGYEYRGVAVERRAVAGRLLAVALSGAVAFAIYRGGPGPFPGPVPGGEDLFASVGLIAGFAALRLVWRRRQWGRLVPAYCLLVIGTSVLHLLVVPFWDVSSHVVYAAVSTGALAVVDRRFLPLLAVPPALAWSRTVLEAHTAAQSVGGLAVAALVVAGAVLTDRVPRTRAGDRT